MKKISKEKQAHLALVAIGTVGAIAALWFFVITAQKARIVEINRLCEKVEQEKTKERRIIKGSGVLMDELKDATNKLVSIEHTMPSGDLYSWIVSSIKQFNVPSYKVSLNQFSTPAVGDMRMFPNYPYSQVTVNLSGSAYFYDLGKFVADLENQFPYMRVQNIYLDPSISTTPQEMEKVFFHFEVISLVKPSAALVAAQ